MCWIIVNLSSKCTFENNVWKTKKKVRKKQLWWVGSNPHWCSDAEQNSRRITTHNLYVCIWISYLLIKKNLIFYNYILGCYSHNGTIGYGRNVSACYQFCHDKLQNAFQHFAFKVKSCVLQSPIRRTSIFLITPSTGIRIRSFWS